MLPTPPSGRPDPRSGSPALPPGFVLGTSTSAYQIEGAAQQDGRGPSTWDTFSREPGRIVDGSNADVTCDHYHRFDEDIALLADLGAPGYRFSLSWSRLQPTGRGPVNAAGMDFYDRLLDRLLDAGIDPMVTLHHFDLPQALEDDGGWLNRATAEAFADFATLAGDRFADRVAHWVPINEPNVVTLLGHAGGMHAPGHQLVFDALPAAHHLLLAHGHAVVALREAGASSVGCANNHAPMWPATEDAADLGATKLFDALWNGLFIEPMLLGRYPVDLAPLLEDVVVPGDLAMIRQPLDFYGVNYYQPFKIGATPEDAEIPFESLELLGYPTTDLGRPIVPDALREWLIMTRARFRSALPPLVITESGGSFNDEPDADGVVDDQGRIDYLDAHLRAVGEAAQRGVDVRGYYAWSLLDNWEWTEGFTQRFGLVHVDFETLVRTPKRSFAWYRDLVASQPRSLG
ncbi:GH1 family beta-glucosidase [Nocardioides sp.]|uniref:GH1 family beta-glucosidase n=1 Tax=Nocardioides sp. TaxID=35761 RepID=UPI002B277F10|nr:GH1 family beta-glucosidase [Nocardioides sp.]